MNDTLVLIGGSPRGGSTLLHRVLTLAAQSHPPISESAYLVDQLRIFFAGLQRYDVGYKDYFGERDNFAAFTRETLELHFRATLARFVPASALVLAHPEATPAFPLLAEWFPRARFVVGVRDPRDAIASMVEAGARAAAEGRRSPLAGIGRDVQKLCNLFKNPFANVLRPEAAGRDRTVFVRYEDVRGADERGVRALGERCGLTFGPDLPRRLAEVVARDPDGGPGRHREVLTPEEAAQVQARCADFNAVFPYW